MTAAFAEFQSVSVPFPPPYEVDCVYSVGEYPIFMCTWRGPAIPFEVKAELEQLERSIDILPTEEYEASKTKIIMSWLNEVKRIIQQNWKVSEEFNLTQVYDVSEEYLSSLYPHNRFVQQKIQQTLQQLRDKNIIEFIDNNGNYKRIGRLSCLFG